MGITLGKNHYTYCLLIGVCQQMWVSNVVSHILLTTTESIQGMANHMCFLLVRCVYLIMQCTKTTFYNQIMVNY